MKRHLILLDVFFVFLTSVFAGDKKSVPFITTGSLFEEMIDMVQLASFPEPAFRTVQFSSYDHLSRLPGGPDWFANADGFGGESIPNFEKVLREPDENGVGEYLIADVTGPGAVVRLWTAAISGTVRVTIDDSEDPIYNGDADAFFHHPYDSFPEMKKINTERFRRTVYQRDASYAPIPFTKRLRVVWTGKVEDIHFYQLQVRLYPEGTPMKSFSSKDILTYRKIIDRVTMVLSDPDLSIPSLPEDSVKTFEAALEPSEKKEVLYLDGQNAVGKFTLRLNAEDMDKALRQTVLQITCDGYPWGQVLSPVGDFFGAAPGVNPYSSLPFTVLPDTTMVCRFVMPFEKSIRIELENRGEQNVSVRGSVLFIPFTWDDRSLHFRARWRIDHNLIASNESVQDLPFLLAHGKGVYVGTTSYILNPNPIPTPWGNWWGEGDEKVFVDDDTRPSIFGTGSEDYFNYSWSSPDIFYYPYCGQPRNDGPGNRGFVTNFRYHILDPIPFKNNIRFYMELFSHERTPGLSYGRIGYHYARPGITDDFLPVKPEDLRYLQLPENWHPASRFGARNSTFYSAEDVVANGKDTHLEAGRLWAGGNLLIWTPKKKGQIQNFLFRIENAGEKRIHMTAALTPRSGKIRFLLDGRGIQLPDEANTIDLCRPDRTLLRNFTLTTDLLTAGDHTLTLEYKGTEKGNETPEIGIDFFWIQDIKRTGGE